MGERVRSSTVLGTGFIALDVVISSDAPDRRATWVGGTCGNVLSILSYLGWASYPLSRMNGDGAASRIREDLSECGVRLNFASLTPTANTPVVIHHIRRRRSGEVTHRFSVNCPDCGTRTPSYRPVTRVNAEAVADQLPAADVFFLDRVSRAALELAKAAARAGAVVVFEPSGLGDPGLFREALGLTDVLKYSRDRLGWLAETTDFDRHPVLEVETLGRQGLRYRARLSKGRDRKWRTLSAYQPWSVVDGAGAGDWCTAGILHSLGRGGRQELSDSTRDRLEEALRFGQAAGAWACGFEGARGGMYRHHGQVFEAHISALRAGEDEPRSSDPDSVMDAPTEPSVGWCQGCMSDREAPRSHR